MFRDLLLKRVSGFCALSATQIEKLREHYELLERWNRTINLTRIEDLAEAVERHYAESLFLGSLLPPGSLRIADLGSGAGFPGIPVAVLRPDCDVTLIESHQRKAVFLKESARSLENVSVLATRIENITTRFDWVISRAVAPPSITEQATRLAPNWASLSRKGIPLPWDSLRGVEIRST